MGQHGGQIKLILRKEHLRQYVYLIRLHKPIGTLLLLWPTLWALWFASNGRPDWSHILIFCIGTLLMRSAGCAVNDYADRNFDRHVKRTQYRPLTAGEIEPKEALAVAAVLAVMAFGCVLFLNQLTIFLSFMALAIAVFYPFTKRFFSIPQAILGIAFGFGIPMAYAAELGQVPLQAYILLSANIFWAIAYDTAYAMVDREDDLRIGIRTSAITFGSYDVLIIFLCYVAFLSLLGYLAVAAQLNHWFWVGWLCASGCAAYHFLLVRTRNPEQCFQAFNHNNYLGACIFAGIFFAYW